MHQVPQPKKLVSVSATSISVTGAKKAPKVRVLDKIPCIHYPVKFCSDKNKDVLALLDSGSKVNTMTPAYAAYLGLKVRVINIGAQKVDGSLLATYSMVIIVFQVVNNLVCSWFFYKTFLLANIIKEVVLDMLFVTFNNADV